MCYSGLHGDVTVSCVCYSGLRGDVRVSCVLQRSTW